MKKFKILYLVSTLRKTGPTRQLFNIINNLDSCFIAQIVTMSPEPDESLREIFLKRNIVVKTLGLNRVEGLFFAKTKLLNILKEFHPDIVHSNGFRSDCIISGFKNVPKITTLRNCLFEDYPLNYGAIKGKLMILCHIKALKMFPTIVSCSNSVSIQLMKHSIHTHTIQNGVDTEQFYPADNELKKYLRNKLGLPQNHTIFISTGHLSRRKDPFTIIEGFIRSPINQQSSLVLIGDGHLRSRCTQYSSGNENILFTGRVENVQEYLQASDIFISASKAEGLPNAVLEALACGLPVILSNIPAHKEILRLGTNAGSLFEIGDTETLISSMLKINENYRVRKSNALKIINNYMDAKIMSKKYQDLYIRVKERKPMEH